MKRIALIALATVGQVFAAYTPPIGIPNPNTQFGWEIDRATPSFPTEWTQGSPTEKAGFYYIDKTSGTATDTANPYGYPTKPRKSIPEGTLAAGTFIYVNAGTYTASDSSGDRYDWSGTGTSGNPIWITGNPTTKPVITDLCHIGATASVSYLIFENFELNGGSAGLTIKPATDGNTINHVLVRNVKRVGTGTNTDAQGISISISQATDTFPNSPVTDIVIYNCDISYTGDPAPQPPDGNGSDTHGVEGGYHTNRVWILNNVIHHVGGDSVQASHYGNYDTKLAQNFYIGGNTFYGNGENGIDLKNMQGFVISQNEIFGPFTREQGWAIVMHYGALTQFHCRNGVIIFNNIHHVSSAIATGTSSGVDNLDVIGNKIWDIKASYGYQPDTSLNGACIQLGGSTVGANSVYRFVNNTFSDYERGFALSPHAGDTIKSHGNIFSRAAGTTYELEVPNNLQNTVTMDYDLYFGTPAFLVSNGSRTLAYMKSTLLQESHSVTGDPLFTNAAGGDFHLGTNSPAIDAAVEGPVGDSAYTAYLTFSQAHTLPSTAINIKVDYDQGTRPVDTLWDIGAFESALPPPAPSNLQAH